MFTSLGFWRNIPCPYLDSDKPCQRPYCQFKHSEENADNSESSTLNGGNSRIDQDCQPTCNVADIPRVQKLAVPVETTRKDDSPPVQTPWVPKHKPLVYKPTPIAELRKRKRIKEEQQNEKSTAAKSRTPTSSANYVEANSFDSFVDKSCAPTNSCINSSEHSPECPVDESKSIDLTEVSSNVPNAGEDLENEMEEESAGDEAPSEGILSACDAKDSEQPEEADNDQCLVAASELSDVGVSAPIVEISDQQPPIENDEPIGAGAEGCVLHVANVFGDDSDDDEEFRRAYSSRVSFRKSLAAPLAPHASKRKVNAEQSTSKSVEIDDSGYSSFDRRAKPKAASPPPSKEPVPYRANLSSTVKSVIVKAPVIHCVEEVPASLQDDEVDLQEALIMKKRRISKVVSCDKSDEKPRVAFNPKCRIPISVRQRYLDLFVEECLKQCPAKEEAFAKAIAEEESVATVAHSTKGYTVSAVNRLRRLRCAVSTALVPAQITSGSTDGKSFYDALMSYVLTEEQMRNNGFPLPDENCPSRAVFALETVARLYRPMNDFNRLCCRCGKTFQLTKDGSYAKRSDECIHHYSKAFKRRGFLEAKYWCCQGDLNSVGCCAASYHVTDMFPDSMLDNYVRTGASSQETVFALDCEMVYTTKGPSLARVTVVDGDLNVVCERTVKPEGELLDCNTRFSGMTSEMVLNAQVTLADVQKELTQLFGENCILIGHGLENDLRALKIIHQRVVDTSVVFPHRLGAPYKRGLKALVAEYLKKIIQEDASGHDSKEDASVCIELMKWKISQDCW